MSPGATATGLSVEIGTTVLLLESTIGIVAGYSKTFIDRCPPAHEIWDSFIQARNALASSVAILPESNSNHDRYALDILAIASDLIDRMPTEFPTAPGNSSRVDPRWLGRADRSSILPEGCGANLSLMVNPFVELLSENSTQLHA
jgi:hypothetical protein